MEQQFFNIPNLLYWIVLAIVIFIEQRTLGRLWRNKEAHRWTMGYATVFFLSIPLVALGYWDIITWAGLFFAVGIAGAIKTGCEQYHASREAQQIRLHGHGINGAGPVARSIDLDEQTTRQR